MTSATSPPITHVSPQGTSSLRVGDLLIQKGLITSEQVARTVAYQREKGHAKLLGELLVELEFVTEEQVLEVLAEACDVPFARLSPEVVDLAVVDTLPREFIEKNDLLPLYRVRNLLTVAVTEPANVFLVEELERLSGCNIQIVAATHGDIQSTLQAFMPESNVFDLDGMMDEVGEDELNLVEEEISDISDPENALVDAPVVKLVNFLIHSAVKEGASDIHVEPDEAKLRVRFRVDGRLFEKTTPPVKMLPAIVSRVKIMAGLDISERRVPQDGGISIRVDGRQVDLRVSTCPGKFGEKLVLRVIDKSAAMLTLDTLGFSQSMYERFQSLVSQPNGVVLVTGPTGSGKSTTLYAGLSQINTEDVNISTVEDPVEFNLGGINQFQTNEKAGFHFAGALRSLLRQDPDVVMLGEIRDQETARIATQAALTGHLVLSTLHTNDAPSAITRLINVGVEPYLIAAAVRGVLAQRLLRKVCQHCKQPLAPDAQQQATLERMFPNRELPQTLYQGSGCGKCRQTGYAGRLGIYELYTPDDEALDAISRNATLQELRRLALDSGNYTTLRDDGFEKLSDGRTTLEELVKATAM